MWFVWFFADFYGFLSSLNSLFPTLNGVKYMCILILPMFFSFNVSCILLIWSISGLVTRIQAKESGMKSTGFQLWFCIRQLRIWVSTRVNYNVQEHWLFCKQRSLELSPLGSTILLPNLKPSRVLVAPAPASGIPCVGIKKTTVLFLTDPFTLLQLNFYQARSFM